MNELEIDTRGGQFQRIVKIPMVLLPPARVISESAVKVPGIGIRVYRQPALHFPGFGVSAAASKLLAHLWRGLYTECTLGCRSTKRTITVVILRNET